MFQIKSVESQRTTGSGLPSQPEQVKPGSNSRRASFVWLLIGLALLVFTFPLQYSLAKSEPSTTLWLYRWGGYLGFVLGVLALVIGAYSLGSERFSAWWSRIQREVASRTGISEVQIPLLVGSLGFALLGAAGAGDKPLMINPTVGLISWAAGIILAVAGFWFSPASARKVRSALAWALLFSFAALLIRLPDLNLPPFSGDESSAGMDALLFLRGTANTFFRPAGWHQFPGLYFFLEAVSIQMLGKTVLAVRLSSVVIGALTVGVLFFSARALFGHRIAVIAAVLLAVSPFHIFSSHVGLNNVWDALGYTAFVGALWYGWKNGRRNAFLLAGLALGLAQFFYSTSQMMLLLALGGMIAAFFIDRVRFKKNIAGWIGMFLVAGVAVMPIAFYLFAQPNDFSAHSLSRSIFQPNWFQSTMQATGSTFWQVVWSQLCRGFGAFTFVSSGNWFKPDAPLLRSVEAAFFLAGLVLLALKPRDLRSWLLVGWVGIFGIVGTLSESVPTSQRYIGSAPVLALLVAFALVEIWSQLSRLIPSAGRWAAAVSVALVLLVAVDNLNFTFGDYFPNTPFRGKYDFEGPTDVVANQIVALLQERQVHYEVVYLSGVRVETRPLQFLLPGYQDLFFTKPYGSTENPKLEGSHFLFILPAVGDLDLQRLMADYPGGTKGDCFNWDGRLLFRYYDVVIPTATMLVNSGDDHAVSWREACEPGPAGWSSTGLQDPVDEWLDT